MVGETLRPPRSSKVQIDVRNEDDKVVVEWPYVVGDRLTGVWLFMLALCVGLGILAAKLAATTVLGALACGAGALFCFWWIVWVVPYKEAVKLKHNTQLVFHVGGQIDLPWTAFRGYKKVDYVSDRTWKDLSHCEMNGASQWGWKAGTDQYFTPEPHDVFLVFQDGGRDVLLRTEFGRDYAAQIQIAVNQGIEEVRKLGALAQIVQDDLSNLGGNGDPLSRPRVRDFYLGD